MDIKVFAEIMLVANLHFQPKSEPSPSFDIWKSVKFRDRNDLKILQLLCICMYMISALKGHGDTCEPVVRI
jgi:hypothetical protein